MVRRTCIQLLQIYREMDGQRDGGSEIWELAVDQQSRFRLSGEDTEQATGFVTLDSRHSQSKRDM